MLDWLPALGFDLYLRHWALDVPPSLRYGETSERLPRRSLGVDLLGVCCWLLISACRAVALAKAGTNHVLCFCASTSSWC